MTVTASRRLARGLQPPLGALCTTTGAADRCPKTDGGMQIGHPRGVALSQWLSGGVLLSHNLPVAVPSALKGLTSGFGMGPCFFRYGRRNSGGNTRTHTHLVGGVSKLVCSVLVFQTGPSGVVGWELRSGREQAVQELLW